MAIQYEQMMFTFGLDQPQNVQEGEPIELLPLHEYDVVVVHISAGKDSMGSFFQLIKNGVDLSKVELWHQAVDGHGEEHQEFWDWPCTEPYIEAVGKKFGVPVYYQWRRGGLYGELMRENSYTGDVFYKEGDQTICLPTTKGKLSTRRKFPAQSADLRIRWCSSYKVDSAKRTLGNNPRMSGTLEHRKKILWVTGERRAEGGNRANYLEKELHGSTSRRRLVHHWRPVIDMKQADIFALFREFKIMPHPAYYLGFGRVSCMGCIFSTAHQWAAYQYIAPERVARFAEVEKEIDHTIDVKLSVLEKVANGSVSKVLPIGDPLLPRWVSLALSRSFSVDDLVMEDFIMPAGAFRGCEGGSP
ncbi:MULTISPECIES: phosphoadenosine phosphosulfate reductase family protein [unclassified Cohnella]|uniref:phosphoadenosine phosphosulfate reductase domain-containing protein n=1 Tax=unclassified Cohnella TaxID=2636738 RepID=UPI001E582FDE|nr:MULTISPECIES: phosphoadenosine phosphosulfate reductase family protein [unclassified Cohnella]